MTDANASWNFYFRYTNIFTFPYVLLFSVFLNQWQYFVLKEKSQNTLFYEMTNSWSKGGCWWFMAFDASFNNISVMSWLSVLLVKETGEPVENHWQTFITSPWTGFKLTTSVPLISTKWTITSHPKSLNLKMTCLSIMWQVGGRGMVFNTTFNDWVWNESVIWWQQWGLKQWKIKIIWTTRSNYNFVIIHGKRGVELNNVSHNSLERKNALHYWILLPFVLHF